MAERARFEIFPEQKLHCGTYLHSSGRYRWRFCIAGETVCSSDRAFDNSDGANDDIHAFMRAIDAAECGIHPDIIDLDEAP
jgi:hypothetical protein